MKRRPIRCRLKHAHHRNWKSAPGPRILERLVKQGAKATMGEAGEKSSTPTYLILMQVVRAVTANNAALAAMQAGDRELCYDNIVESQEALNEAVKVMQEISENA